MESTPGNAHWHIRLLERNQLQYTGNRNRQLTSNTSNR